LIEIGYQRRLRKTLHEQTDKQTNRQPNRQTDTTKIMVTWPWTNGQLLINCSWI